MRSQLEKIKREVDRVLTLVDEGLKSIGPEEFNNLDEANSVAENFQRGPNSHQNPKLYPKPITASQSQHANKKKARLHSK